MKLQIPDAEPQTLTVLRIFGPWGLKFIWGLVLGICSFASLARADVPPAFREAAVLYDQGQFDQAVARYESLFAAGMRSANLYFNLGNAHFKAGRLGRAILNYERARRLDPRDRDINGNLGFVAKQAKSYDAAAAGSWSVWLADLRESLTTDEWTWLVVICYWLALLGAIALVWLPPAVEWKRRLRSASSAFGVVALLASVGLGAAIAVEEGLPAGITVAKEVVVRFAPVNDAMRHFTAYEGQKLWIVSERPSRMQGVPGWVEVERADGMKGWVPGDAIEKI
ncbi:MAG: tetratricopeptide repeat protein [Verrucomicrobia bacterium]|nr:tetratricopeptide repeat protein [Verrucomicrobiota bacterium]